MARAIDPFTGSKGYQGRSFEDEAAGPMTIDPFAGGENIRKMQRFAGDVQDYGAQLRLQNAPNMERSLPAIVNVPIESVPREGLSMPRSRGPAPLVEAPTGRGGQTRAVQPRGLRAQPAAFVASSPGQTVPDVAAERRKLISYPIYRGENARVSLDEMVGRKTPQQVALTPDQQAIVDAFYDELDKWTVTDEATGMPRITGNRVDLGFMDRGTARAIAEVEAMDLQRAMEIEAARRAALPKRKVMI